MTRILIVEDNEMNRDMLSRRLERKGYSITMAVDGGAGVEKAIAEIPDLIRRYVPQDVKFVDGTVLTFDSTRFGFIGGGLPKVGIPGEVSLPDYARKVKALGPVDVVCAHVPPAVDDLTFDTAANFSEPGSEALLEYIEEHSPTHVYFGHVHTPRAASTEIGGTHCVNVGSYYRTTGTAWEHSA